MTGMASGGAGSSFLDEWLTKRKQINSSPKSDIVPSSAQTVQSQSVPAQQPSPIAPQSMSPPSFATPLAATPPTPITSEPTSTPQPFTQENEHLHLRGEKSIPDGEVSVKLRK